MGQLLRELSRYVEFDDASKVEALFQTALDGRNLLMDHFFLDSKDLLSLEEGRMDLLSEVVAIERILEEGRIAINAMRISMCEALDVPDEYLDKQ